MNDRIMNVLEAMTFVTVVIITVAAPFIVPEEKDPEPVRKFSVNLNFDLDAPDVSEVLEVAENREKALAVLNAAQEIFDRIDAVDPEIVIPPTLTYDIPLSYSFNPTYADVWIVEEN